VTGAPDALEGAERLPHVAPLQLSPESDQVTPEFFGSPITVAVKLCAWLTSTDEVVGERPTEMADGLLFIAPEPQPAKKRTSEQNKGTADSR
jgi:hypothetical protein